MWFFIFSFVLIAWLIYQQGKNFNKSIQILEERIQNQEIQINKLHARVHELERR